MSDLYTGILELTDRDFEHTLSAAKRPLLIDFYADWCGPCHSLSPVLSQVAIERGNHVIVGKVNLERAPIAARTFGIQAIPTVVILSQGLVRERLVGVHPRQAYLDAIDRIING